MISKDNSLSLSSNVYNNKSNVEKINFWIDKDPKNNIVRFYKIILILHLRHYYMKSMLMA